MKMAGCTKHRKNKKAVDGKYAACKESKYLILSERAWAMEAA